MIGIVVALADEISSLSHQKLVPGQCIQLTENIMLICSGAGAENAHLASQQLIDQGASHLISWGCAAALDTHLQPGDLVIPQRLHSHSNLEISINNPWIENTLSVLSALKPDTGKLIEGQTIVTQSIDKQKIHQSTQAIALDMESIAIAKVAQDRQLPILVIRVIVDPSTMDLPRSIPYALDSQGIISLSRLLRFIVTHPSEIPELVKLGIYFQQAKNKLKCVAKQLDTIADFEKKIAPQ